MTTQGLWMAESGLLHRFAPPDCSFSSYPQRKATIVPVLANVGPLDLQSLRPNPKEVNGGYWGAGLTYQGIHRQASVQPLSVSCPQVDEVFELSLAHLLQTQNQGYTHFCQGGHFCYTLPVFLHGPHRVWGITAVITELTLKLLAPGIYQPSLAVPELPRG